MNADPDYDEIEQLIDNDPIALGRRCRAAEARLEEVTAERDRAVELLEEAESMLFNYQTSYDPFPWRDEYRAFLSNQEHVPDDQ